MAASPRGNSQLEDRNVMAGLPSLGHPFGTLASRRGQASPVRYPNMIWVKAGTRTRRELCPNTIHNFCSVNTIMCFICYKIYIKIALPYHITNRFNSNKPDVYI